MERMLTARENAEDGHLYPEMTGPVMEALDALTTTAEPADVVAAAAAERKRKGDPR